MVEIGDTFHRLRVLEKHPPRRFVCACSCGVEVNISGSNWKRQKSCGCLKRELHLVRVEKLKKSPEELKAADTRRGRKYRATNKFKLTRAAYKKSEAGAQNRARWRVSARCKKSRAARKESGRSLISDRKYYYSGKGQARAKEQAARRRGALILGDLDASTWENIQKSWGCCAYCGDREAKLTLEHVVPIIQGGVHSRYNVVPACAPCNYGKGASDREGKSLLWLQNKIVSMEDFFLRALEITETCHQSAEI